MLLIKSLFELLHRIISNFSKNQHGWQKVITAFWWAHFASDHRHRTFRTIRLGSSLFGRNIWHTGRSYRDSTCLHVSAPSVWNSLLAKLHSGIISHREFRDGLKTQLFIYRPLSTLCSKSVQINWTEQLKVVMTSAQVILASLKPNNWWICSIYCITEAGQLLTSHTELHRPTINAWDSGFNCILLVQLHSPCVSMVEHCVKSTLLI